MLRLSRSRDVESPRTASSGSVGALSPFPLHQLSNFFIQACFLVCPCFPEQDEREQPLTKAGKINRRDRKNFGTLATVCPAKPRPGDVLVFFWDC